MTIKSLLIENISFELTTDYHLAPGNDGGDIQNLFIPFQNNFTLEHRRIKKDSLVVDVFVDIITSWIGVEEYVYARYFNGIIPTMRKFFHFQDLYPAVIVQTTDSETDDSSLSESQRRSKTCFLTISIMLSHSLLITFRSIINSSKDWDEVHNIMNSLRFSNPIQEGVLKLNSTLVNNKNLEMQLPSVFCTTLEENRVPIPRKFTDSLFNRSNLVFEIVSPYINRRYKNNLHSQLGGSTFTHENDFPAFIYCGFSLFKVFSESLSDFIEKYQNEHAPAPEKLDQNLKLKNTVCRFFHFKSDQHTFMDCIFQHPEFKKEVFIFSIFVDRSVSIRQLGIYVTNILNCLETLEITKPVMSNMKNILHYESKAYKFSLFLPSDSIIIENPVPLSTDCILTITSQIILKQKSPKIQVNGTCRTQVTKINREVPEEEEPDPENLANIKRDQLVKIYSEDCVHVGFLNDEWSTRYTYSRQNKFIVGTYIFYNASEIYLFESEVVSNSDSINDQVICLHNTIAFK